MKIPHFKKVLVAAALSFVANPVIAGTLTVGKAGGPGMKGQAKLNKVGNMFAEDLSLVIDDNKVKVVDKKDGKEKASGIIVNSEVKVDSKKGNILGRIFWCKGPVVPNIVNIKDKLEESVLTKDGRLIKGQIVRINEDGIAIDEGEAINCIPWRHVQTVSTPRTQEFTFPVSVTKKCPTTNQFSFSDDDVNFRPCDPTKTLKSMIPLLEECAKAGQPLHIIAEDIDGEALCTVVINQLSDRYKRPPKDGDSVVPREPRINPVSFFQWLAREQEKKLLKLKDPGKNVRKKKPKPPLPNVIRPLVISNVFQPVPGNPWNPNPPGNLVVLNGPFDNPNLNRRIPGRAVVQELLGVVSIKIDGATIKADKQGNIIEIKRPDNSCFEPKFDGDGNIIEFTETTPDGTKTTWTRSPRGSWKGTGGKGIGIQRVYIDDGYNVVYRPKNIVDIKSYVVCPDGSIKDEDDPYQVGKGPNGENITIYGDGAVLVKNPDGTSRRFIGDGRQIVYDDGGRVIAQFEEDGSGKGIKYDSSGNPTGFVEIDCNGLHRFWKKDGSNWVSEGSYFTRTGGVKVSGYDVNFPPFSPECTGQYLRNNVKSIFDGGLFTTIDTDGNGQISQEEIDKGIISSSITPTQAAIVVAIRKNFDGVAELDGKDSISLGDVSELGRQLKLPRTEQSGLGREISSQINSGIEILGDTNKKLFPGEGDVSIDPRAAVQGDYGHCYFFAGVGAFTKCPQAVRSTFESVETDENGVRTITVRFNGAPNEPIKFQEATPGEILLVTPGTKYGTWSPNLHKAYGIYLNKHFYRRDYTQVFAPDIPGEALGRGGAKHEGVTILCGGDTDDWKPSSMDVEKLHKILQNAQDNDIALTATVNGKSRLQILGELAYVFDEEKKGETPEGLTRKHEYAITNYQNRVLTIYNPTGQEPTIKSIAHLGDNADGLYRITIYDFQKLFDGIHVSDTPIKPAETENKNPTEVTTGIPTYIEINPKVGKTKLIGTKKTEETKSKKTSYRQKPSELINNCKIDYLAIDIKKGGNSKGDQEKLSPQNDSEPEKLAMATGTAKDTTSEPIPIRKAQDSNKIKIELNGTGTDTLNNRLTIINTTKSAVNIIKPAFQFFEPSKSGYQFMVNTKDPVYSIKPGEKLSLDIETICVSTKLEKPPQPKEVGVEYRIADYPDVAVGENLIQIIKSAEKLGADGAFNTVPINPTYRWKKIAQTSVWRYLGSRTKRKTDDITKDSMRDDMMSNLKLDYKKLPKDKRKKIDTMINAILDAVDKTLKSAKVN